MPLKNVHYQKLETEESDLEEDELPPSHVKLQGTNHVKGDRWNHIDNLDEFFERVYQYHQNHGLWAITLSDIMELFQFLFIVCFSVFIVTCLRFNRLFLDKITYVKDNTTNERDIVFGDLFDQTRLLHMPALLVFVLLVALSFWLHRVYLTARRFLQFWEIRTFYHHALGISTSQMRNVTWAEILVRLKQAQKDHKMNIRKQELTELDVYHRILRFQNYLVAMINKNVLPGKIHVPFYGEKVFFTHGLKLNYDLLLFCECCIIATYTLYTVC
jgi:autophagy-related protein 9